MQKRVRTILGLLGVAALAAACSAGSGGSLFGNAGGSDGAGGGSKSTGTGIGAGGADNGAGGDISFTTGTGTDTGTGTVCNNAPDADGDKDGWTTNEGDCNDCDPNVNPGAIEVVATDPMAAAADEDCDGQVDNVASTCDDNLALDSTNAIDAARAVELCQAASQNPASKKDLKWGVIHAAWVLPDGSPAPASPNYHLGHGILDAFGPNVHTQAGKKMLGLSSGTARQPTEPGYSSVGGFDKQYTSGSPAGFPKESPACPGTITGTPHDGAAVELQIRTPTNATGFSFDFNFFTYEWPGFVCSMYNDFFVALLSPTPAGQTDGNISFDQQGNPVSVNNAFVEVCGCFNGPPCSAGGKSFTCSLGTSGLDGTGFEQHASTSWLVTKAPVKGGETITLRWNVYDSGDGVLDTTTLIDNWQWVANGGTVTVGTDPIGTPK